MGLSKSWQVAKITTFMKHLPVVFQCIHVHLLTMGQYFRLFSEFCRLL